MEKKSLVQLNNVESEQLHQFVKQLSGSSQKVRRTQKRLDAGRKRLRTFAKTRLSLALLRHL